MSIMTALTMKTLLMVTIASLSRAFLIGPTRRGPLTYPQHHQPSTWPSSTAIFEEKQQQGGGILDFLFNPYESKIPKEIEKEIYDAEGNTPAAKDRSKRIALYALFAFVGVGCAFFNGFITELRSSPTPEGQAFVLAESTFAWVEASFVTRFLFMNKIGGGLALLLGAGSGLLAEAELDSRRTNAEKIYEELVRRRSNAEKKKEKKVKKKRRSGKEQKRLTALSEVVLNEDMEDEAAAGDDEASQEETPSVSAKENDGGLFGKIKGFYEKADSLAASQALLLNKELEDRGLVEKITDETGLRVIGKEAAQKLNKKESDNSNDSSMQP